MKWKKAILRWLKRTTIVGVLSLFLMEFAYRFQWIDFYRSEWNYHNAAVKQGQTKILVFGDSFTADPRAWLTMLRDSFPTHAIYNAAMPGIGPETHHRIFNRRMEEVRPDHVIVQLYVGNDLYDIKHPVNWSEHGLFRNLFWSVSNDFAILNYFNYRLGQALPDDLGHHEAKEAHAFSVAGYSARTKMYIRGDATYPSSVIDPPKDDARMIELCAHLRAMKASCPKGCRFTVLLIPHSTQVDPREIESYRKLGAVIREEILGKSPWKKSLRGMEVIDPIDAFLSAVRSGKQLYYPSDPHLNALGNQVLMRVVADEL